jgi:hypothetical protein
MKMKENQVNKYYIVPVSNTAYGIKFSKNTAYAAEAVEKARDNKLEVIETKSDYIIRTSSRYSKTEKMNIESGISYTDPMYAESLAEEYEQKLGLTKDQYKICGIVKKYNEYRVNYPFTEKEFVQAWAAEMDSWGTREGHWDTYLYGDEHFDYWYTSDKKLHYGYGAGNYGQFYAFYVHREVLHKESVYKFTIKDLGTYTVTTRGINNYKGTLTRTITIKRKTITEDMISKIPDQEVTGKAVKPEITVTYGDFKLSPGTDYSVSYKNNIEEGTATVIVKGKGNYEGTVTRTFKIGPRTIKESMVAKIPDQEYTGWWIQPDIVVTYDGVKLSEGKDYTVYYYNNRDKGTAVAYIEGQGLFSGWATVTFEIVDKQPDGSKVFLDVQDPSAWYYDAVYWAAENGITSGYGEGTFQPMANLSRAQVVTFLYNLAGKPSVSDKAATDFTDVPENAWYYKAVRWAVANGITSGYGQGTFKPNVICNRAMIVTFLMNYAEKNQMYREPVTMSSFKDVPANAWYKKSVDWAVENNITSGYGENSFQPLVPCNRAMMVVFLKKLSELPKVS